MSVAAFLAVGIGGAFGALCRSKATSFLKPRFPGRFPLPTLFINLLSCTSAGALIAFQIQLDGIAYLALTMGFLGGFSTLSKLLNLFRSGITQKALDTLQRPTLAPLEQPLWASP